MPDDQVAEQMAEMHEALIRIANHTADTKRYVGWILAIVAVTATLGLLAVFLGV